MEHARTSDPAAPARAGAAPCDGPPQCAASQVRRIRVAFLLDSFAVGGTELNAVRTAEALDPGRFDLRVVHLRADGPLRERYERLRVPMKHLPIGNLYGANTASQGLALARQLRDWGIQVAHSHDIYNNIFAVPWARMRGRCAVVASRRWSFEVPRRSLAVVNRWAYRFAHVVVANSAAIARLLADEGVPERKIVEIRNFLSPQAFVQLASEEIARYRRSWGVPEQAFVIGCVARLTSVKNHALAIDALGALDERFHLVLIGDGPERDGLEDRARRGGMASRVHFAGEVVSGTNLHQCFDVSILCSHNEGFPNALLEGMAACRPVVATPVGGVADAVRHEETGLLVDAGDPSVLATALRRLASDAALGQRLAAAGQRLVQSDYSAEAAVAKLAATYRCLAESRRLPVAGAEG